MPVAALCAALIILAQGEDAFRTESLATINRVRSELGLSPATLDDRLNQAAQAHADYMWSNLGNPDRGQDPHAERPGLAGFTGADPSRRAHAAGYGGGVNECMELTTYVDPKYVVHLGTRRLSFDMLDAPYHRIPFIAPGEVHLGIGHSNNAKVWDFGTKWARGLVIYPYDGQTAVPDSVGAGEAPNPWRIHDRRPSGFGFPITVTPSYYGQVHFEAATLSSEEGGEEPISVNHPDNDDHLRYDMIVLPHRRLRPGCWYTSVVKFSSSTDGEVEARTRFRVRTAWEDGDSGRRPSISTATYRMGDDLYETIVQYRLGKVAAGYILVKGADQKKVEYLKSQPMEERRLLIRSSFPPNRVSIVSASGKTLSWMSCRVEGGN